ncbi:hypothetical protein [Desulfitobacterium sp. PCE1]|uniref:hypothetical protein n=1 Tax=Desulfitobacterium sp. PCE1 TaxID=146907 RepID=UPI001FA7EB82|nr:hypothetical protein [Desulfitobacterium sp. PCE1]
MINLRDQFYLRPEPEPPQNRQNADLDSAADAQPEMTSDVNAGQDTPALSYPMTMPGPERHPGDTAEPSSNEAKATDNGEFEPVQTDMDMSVYQNDEEPGSNYELPSDTIS